MNRKVKDWREEGYKVGDKIFMTSQSSFYYDEPSKNEVYISHIGKTVIKVKYNIGDNYSINFSKCSSTLSDFGTFYVLYDNKEEYLKRKKAIEYRDNLKIRTKELVNKFPNKLMEDLIAKYGDK